MKIILFDLNETLVYREYTKQLDGRSFLSISVRPGVVEVIKRLHSKYTLGIASSCTKKNIYSLLGTIFAGTGLKWQNYFAFIFDRDYTLPYPTDDNKYRTIRDVDRIIKELETDRQLLFVDNDEYKYEGSDALRLIVPSYVGQKDDTVMLSLEDSIDGILE